jgi:shikimate dehydrogenase
MRRLAVLGHPVAHSRSPAMQTAALEALGLGAAWSYEAIDVAPAELEARVAAMPGEGFVGANVTVPHKRAALSLAGESTATAAEIGAANTLSFAQGAVRAENTDAGGLIDAIGAVRSDSRALVLGAGGAARAALWALAREGAEVELWNRTAGRGAPPGGPRRGAPAARPPAAVTEPDAAAYAVIVNATAAGLHGEDQLAALPLDPARLSSGQTVVDMVYGDRPSPLLGAADAAGAATVDGIEVLVRQGARSLRIWTGAEPPLEIMRAAARG